MPPEDFFDGLTNLQDVYALAAGVDQLLEHPGLPASATIIRLRDAGMAEQMEEYVLYGVLHAQRRMGALRQAQSAARWASDTVAPAARHTRVGILGAGALGARVAGRIAANGYPVTCWSRSPHAGGSDNTGFVHGEPALEPLLAASDVLVCMLPLTNDTRGILDASLMSRLPRGAFLINPGRGEHLVEQDLLAAIDSGHLSGALLDVFTREPLSADHPFWTHPSIIVTPHIAARSLVEESVEQVVDSMMARQRGEIPAGIVDRQKGY